MPWEILLFPGKWTTLFRGRVTGKILTFADDTRLFRKTKEIGDKKIQDDIDKLVKWSEKWCYSILGDVSVYTQGRKILA